MIGVLTFYFQYCYYFQIFSYSNQPTLKMSSLYLRFKLRYIEGSSNSNFTPLSTTFFSLFRGRREWRTKLISLFGVGQWRIFVHEYTKKDTYIVTHSNIHPHSLNAYKEIQTHQCNYFTIIDTLPQSHKNNYEHIDIQIKFVQYTQNNIPYNHSWYSWYSPIISWHKPTFNTLNIQN